jgi:sulfur-oxidizing protein SoxY
LPREERYMQRRHVLSLLAGVAVCPALQGKPAVPAGPESLIHDLPRTAEALFDLTHGAPILSSARIDLIAPPLVEYAPRWPVRVINRIPGVTWMAVTLEQNPQPLAALFHFKAGALTEVRSYLKIADSTQVTVVVAAAGKFYGLRRFITVVGYCM